ncbi:putative mitochondrial ATP-dependent helicase irc3 [Zancudomyces culisetae]|uniref:Putative mitochondrial ATP-dependent helicase irc3 n=1 Tax=Zancudomyces culisetae TaxID=1213189 RepID=A0A1R1PDM4_ZANCU|nr:putative mitochondrial ATP-dependent helicase irc3 [Zancudomyces culisetae]|eukprot:OMH79019.1 putative mitochondrial ATP-dependent helicase irc3 [Zancudomyces culisetae]
MIKQIKGDTPQATKVLVLAHRKELLYQACSQIRRAAPDLRVDLDQGISKASIAADVIVTSIQTLARKDGKKLSLHDPDLYKCIIIDEAHHAVASSYLRVIEHFVSKYQENGNVQSTGDHEPGVSTPKEKRTKGPVIWGCSATLKRHDGLALGAVFNKIVYYKPLIDMIREGWLCPIKVTMVKTMVDLTSVKNLGDDFNPSSLAKAVDNDDRNNLIVDKYLEFSRDSKEKKRESTLVFTVNVEHARNLTKTFRDRGVDARAVFGNTSQNDRIVLLEEFKKRYFPVLINCEILTEGTDIPNIDCILMARPTRSAVLFQQMIGRGMRLHKDKTDCMIVDFVDVFDSKKSMVNIPTLLGLDPKTTIENVDVLEHFNKKRDNTVPEFYSIPVTDKQSHPSLSSIKHICRRLLDPYHIFTMHRRDMNDFGLHFKKHFSPYDVDVLTTGDPRIALWSKLSWVALPNGKYVFNHPRLSVTIEDKLASNTPQITPATRQTIFTQAAVEQFDHSTTPRYIASYRYFLKKKTSATPSPSPSHMQSKPILLPLQADTLPLAFCACDTFIKSKISNFDYKLYSRGQKWRNLPPSKGQLNFLVKLGAPKSLFTTTTIEIDSAESPTETDPVDSDESTGLDSPTENTTLFLTRGAAANLITRFAFGAGKASRVRLKSEVMNEARLLKSRQDNFFNE